MSERAELQPFSTTVVRSVVATTLMSMLLCAGAQDAPTEAPRTKPKNLQTLPEDISPFVLGRMMKAYEKDLGVRCAYCHVENRDTGKLDYVSDENPVKQKARIMIAMLEDINERHLAQLGNDRRYETGVTCGSCHQGRANPQAFEPRHP